MAVASARHSLLLVWDTGVVGLEPELGFGTWVEEERLLCSVQPTSALPTHQRLGARKSMHVCSDSFHQRTKLMTCKPVSLPALQDAAEGLNFRPLQTV